MISLSFMLLAVAFQFLIGGAIGSIILRASCALFNRVFSSTLTSADSQASLPVAKPVNQPAAPIKSENPYAASASVAGPPQLTTPSGQAIPVPSFGKGFLICAAAILCNVAVGFLVGVFLGTMVGPGLGSSTSLLAIQGLLAIAGIVIFALINQISLPTTFGRALGLAFIFALIAFLVSIAIGIVGATIALLLGGI